VSDEVRDVVGEGWAATNAVRNLINALPALIGYWDTDLRNRLANDAYVEFFGFTPERMLGIHMREVLGEDIFAKNLPYVERALAGEHQRFERLIIDTLGRARHTQASYIPDIGAAGRVRGFFVLVVDITERKIAEERLRQSEENLAVSLQSIGDAMIATDPSGRITEMSPVAERLTGWESSRAVGRPLPDVFHIVDANTRIRLGNPVTRVTARGDVVGSVDHTVLIARNGDERRIIESAAPIRDAAGALVGVVVVFSDVTEAHRVRELLATTRGMLERTGKIAKVGGWELDLRTGGRWWLPELFHLLEIDPPVLPPLDEAMDRFFEPDIVPVVRAAFRAAVEHGEPWDMELPMVTTNGRRIWVRSQGAAVVRDGVAVQLHGVYQDITERKLIEDDRARLEAKLGQAAKLESVGRLAGGIAHDFNNMLEVILGYAGLAMRDIDASHPARESLLEIRSAAERSAALTQQLLAFSRRQPTVPEVLDLRAAVGGVLGMLERLIGSDVELAVELDPDVWPIEIDPSQFDQVLTNLCVNARDAVVAGGGISIRARNVVDPPFCVDPPNVAPGQYVLLTVSDAGAGMDAETVAHIFEPFFTTKEVGAGTGLGLATVYGVVAQNRGFIDVDSEPGVGTTFSVYLPRSFEAAPADIAPATQVVVERGHETLLVVEDEPANLRLMTRVLRDEGYVVLPARNPAEAIELAKSDRGEIQLLLTDVVMPGMNGPELADTLFALGLRVEQLFMSGHPADVSAVRGVLDPGVRFIQKPFSIDDLTVRVRAALDQRRDAAMLPGA